MSSSKQNLADASYQPSRAKTNVAWEYCVQVIKDTKKPIKCLHYLHTFRGWDINRMKQHFAKKGGDVKKCDKMPFDVHYWMRQSLKEIEQSR